MGTKWAASSLLWVEWITYLCQMTNNHFLNTKYLPVHTIMCTVFSNLFTWESDFNKLDTNGVSVYTEGQNVDKMCIFKFNVTQLQILLNLYINCCYLASLSSSQSASTTVDFGTRVCIHILWLAQGGQCKLRRTG